MCILLLSKNIDIVSVGTVRIPYPRIRTIHQPAITGELITAFSGKTLKNNFMLSIYVKDFEGNMITPQVIDKENHISHMIEFSYTDPNIRLLKYVDLYDDTVFNSNMINDLIHDFHHLMKKNHVTENTIEEINRILLICKEVVPGRHNYLIFDGD